MIDAADFDGVPVADWFDRAAEGGARKIELELCDSNVYARVNLLEKRGEITPTHAHPFGHTVVCGRGEIGLEKVVNGRRHLARLRAGMGAWVAAGVRHSMVALEDGSGFACLFPHRTPDGEIVEQWTGWPPGEGAPLHPDDLRITAKTIYVLREDFAPWKAGYVFSDMPPQCSNKNSFMAVTVPDAPLDAFWSLLGNHQGVFDREPSTLPVRNYKLDLSRLRPEMTYAELGDAMVRVPVSA